MDLPDCFCWTRFGTEAGQTIDQILARKEQERLANSGLFLWGIGNSVGAGIEELVRRCDKPEVLFSPIKGAPKFSDVAPESVAVWTVAETLKGEEFPLPPRSLITSRQNNSSPKRTHYALVCCSDTPLSLCQSSFQLSFGSLRNIPSGKAIGASQVTAVVSRDESSAEAGTLYQVAFRANLMTPYFIRLRNPEIFSESESSTTWGTRVQDAWQERLSLD